MIEAGHSLTELNIKSIVDETRLVDIPSYYFVNFLSVERVESEFVLVKDIETTSHSSQIPEDHLPRK